MNKKIIALLMAAAITTGMGGFGTLAYFTDTEEVKNTVNITMGTLDVVTNEGEWQVASAKGEAKRTAVKNDLMVENVKPGDIFYKDITVTNAGSLMSDTSINLNDTFNHGFEVRMSRLNADGQWESANRFEYPALESGKEVTVRLEVFVKTELGNDWQGTGGLFEGHNFITVGAHQVIQ